MPEKSTTETFIQSAIAIHGDKYDYSLVEYVSSKDKVKIRCLAHDWVFEQTPKNHLGGSGCPKCAGQYTPTTEEFIEKAKEVHGDKYDYSLVEYVKASQKVKIRCLVHDWVFEQTPNNHLRGGGCRKCAGKHIPTTEEFIEQAKGVHGDKYDYSLVEYVSSKEKVKIRCLEHDWVFEQQPSVHLGGGGCRKCAGTHTPTTEDFIKKAKEVHGDKYDYSLVEYVNTSQKVKIRCLTHDWVFEQIPNDHLRGAGCPKCAGSYTPTTEEFIEKAKGVHGDKYDYSLVEYVKSSQKVKIRCLEHDWVFEQTPNLHLGGGGCRKCAGKHTPTTEEFIEKAKEVHGDKYDYSLVEYVKALQKVKIRCLAHDWVFEQQPNNHLRGAGCPKCAGLYTPTTEEFIEQAKGVHGDKYDYSLVEYVKSSQKVKIRCLAHDWVFEQTPSEHLQGAGCRKCSGLYTLTTEEFIEKAKEVHGDKYDYSLVEYVKSSQKVKIKCLAHDWVFEQTPSVHLGGSDCPKCASQYTLTTEEFIEKAKGVHGDKYDYSLVEYVKSKDKVKIRCLAHDWVFEQTPSYHLGGGGCPKCAIDNKKGDFLSYAEAKAYLRPLKLKSYDWQEYRKSGNKPDNIPSNPYTVYGDEWKGFADFLGYLGNGNLWTQKALVVYLTQIKDYLHVCSIPQLITIIEANRVDNYIDNKQIKQLQSTKPGSKERELATEQILKEIIGHIQEQGDGFIEQENISGETVSETNIQDETFETATTETQPTSAEEDALEERTKLRQRELKALDNDDITASLDDERVQFLVNDFVNSLWYDVLNGKLDIESIRAMEFKTEVPERIQDDFLAEYAQVQELSIPEGWTYPYEPLLMQKLIAHRLLNHKRYGNWSGVGAGKTIGAILAGRYVGAKNTLVITFNSTIGKEDERGWAKEIKDAFGDSRIYVKTDKYVRFDNRFHNYLILNYETFQQAGSADYVISLLERNRFDYIVLDEVQSVKQTAHGDASKRREVIFGLVSKVKELNPDYYLLAMSATPVINNLVEAKSLVELIDFTKLDEVDTSPTTANCIEMFRRLTNCGIRHKNIGDDILRDGRYTIIDVDANHLATEAEKIKSDDFLAQDRLALESKLEAIRPYLNTSKGKTVIYTYYVDGIDTYVYDYLTRLGFSVGVYTGSKSKLSRDEALNGFINGQYDILLGSKPISTGVDGLQKVSDRLIILSLPWTNAELVQLVGRVNRKGSNFAQTKVDVIIPLASMGKVRWDYNRYNAITYKKTIANAAVDGIIPEKLIVSRDNYLSDAEERLDEWIARLNTGEIKTTTRQSIKVELYPTISDPEERERRINSELMEFNRLGKITSSAKMHQKFKEDPQSWHRYHSLREESMKGWDEIPYEVIAKKITCSSDKVIDFGCGTDPLRGLLPHNELTSIDHVSIDENVIACDMSDISEHVEADSHDVAVFSLSLWGPNYGDYIKEAYRALRRKGLIYIAEPTKHYETEEDRQKIKSILEETGFVILGSIDVREKFIYITAIKI